MPFFLSFSPLPLPSQVEEEEPGNLYVLLTLMPVVLMVAITSLAIFVFLYNKKRSAIPGRAAMCGGCWACLGMCLHVAFSAPQGCRSFLAS